MKLAVVAAYKPSSNSSSVNILASAAMTPIPAFTAPILASTSMTPINGTGGAVGVNIIASASMTPIPAFQASIVASAVMTPVNGGATNTSALDGTPITFNSTTQTATSATFSTTNGSDILVLAIQIGNTGASNTISTVTDTTGLTWTRQATQLWEAANAREISIWTAKAGAGAYSGTVTITLTSAAAYQQRAWLFAFTNPNATILDPNAANPATNTGTLSPIAATISTTNANDILINMAICNIAMGTVTRPSGFTNTVTGGTITDVSYKIVSATQSSVSESTSYTGVSAHNAVIVLALQGT